jgi:endonuclease/exonuclease/phosphatase (EEP) superfamily protein YafD
MKKAKRFAFLAFPVFALVCIFRPPFFISEVIHSLALQITCLFLLLGIALLAKHHYRSGISSALSGLAIGISLLPWLLPAPASPLQGRSDLRVAHFNVQYDNLEMLPMVQQAIDTNADFISFQEVTPAWAAELQTRLGELYPYHFVHAANGGHGIGIYSRLPLQDVHVEWFEKIPEIRGSLCVKDQNVSFITAHMRTPTQPALYAHRNHQLQNMAVAIADTEGPSMVMGDLNTVPWSREITQLLQVSGLHDSRSSLSPTFPSWFSAGMIPIDYILHSSHLECTGFSTVTSGTSDHFGIVSEFVLRGDLSDVCI